MPIGGRGTTDTTEKARRTLDDDEHAEGLPLRAIALIATWGRRGPPCRALQAVLLRLRVLARRALC